MKLKMFKTPTCNVCPQQKEILEGIVEERSGVDLEVIDATENAAEANRFGVRSAPVTVVVDDRTDGLEVEGQFAGLTNADDIKQAL